MTPARGCSDNLYFVAGFEKIPASLVHEQAPPASPEALYREPAGETHSLGLGPDGAGEPVAPGVRGREPTGSRVCVAPQWTPKDDLAALKLHGRCDDVMQLLMAELGLEIPRYDR